MQTFRFLPSLASFALLGAGLQNANGFISLDFATGATLDSGTAETVGAVYRYSNVGSYTEGSITYGIDVLMTLGSLNGGASYDDRGPANWQQSQIGDADDGMLELQPTFDLGQNQFAEFNLKFVQTGNYTPVLGQDVQFVVNDIDSENNNNQNFTDRLFVDATAAGSYTLSNNTLLTTYLTPGTDVAQYLEFSLDRSQNLSSAPNIGRGAGNVAQTPYTVQLDFTSVGAAGINMAFGVGVGTGTAVSQDSGRNAFLDGSGTFIFADGTTTKTIPEPSFYAGLFGAVALLMGMLRRRRSSRA